MIGGLYLILAIFFGWQILNLFKIKLLLWEKISGSIVVGFLFSSWINLIFDWLIGYQLAILLNFFILSLVNLAIFIKTKNHFDFEKAKRINISWTAFAGITFIFFSFIIYWISLRQVGGSLLTSGTAYGDFAFHTTLINYFVGQDKFDFNYPILYQAKLSYPFLIDYASSIFLRLGFNLQMSLIVPQALLLWSFSQLFYGLALRIFKNSSVGWLGFWIFIFFGSQNGLLYILKGLKNFDYNILEFFTKLPQDYTQMEKLGLHFINITSSHLMPQRGIGFGLAILCLIFILLYEHKPNYFLIFAILGLTPFAHTHIFMFGIFLVFSFILTQLNLKKLTTKKMIFPLVLLFVLSLPQLVWQLNANDLYNFVRLQVGWMSLKENVLWFWFKNAGLFLILGCISAIYIFKKKLDIFLKTLLMCSTIIFLLANLIIFQPNDFDNMKFFVPIWMIFSIAVAYILTKINKILIFIFMIILIVPGFLGFLYNLEQVAPLVYQDEMNFAKNVKKIIPQNSQILTTSDHNNPISLFSGRKNMIGYQGWLWSHGYKYTDLENEINQIWQGENEALQLIEDFGIGYIAFETTEGSIFREKDTNNIFFQKNFKLIYEWEDWKIFKTMPSSKQQPSM